MNHNQKKKVWISFEMDEETNDLITGSAERSKRRKRSEAAMRLKDHLLRFKSISEVGSAVSRDKKS